MPDPWCPYATRDPGIRAGYKLGVINPVDTGKCHYTAGYNSWALIKNQGLAQFLITRAGQIVQFAEVNAQCIDSGEWNDDGPGIEIEAAPQYGQSVFTDASRDAAQALCMWLHTEWGIPLTYYDGPRIPENTYRGFISHRSLIQSQPHSDYWPAEDAAIIFAPPAPTPEPEEDDMGRLVSDKTGAWWVLHPSGWKWRVFAPDVDDLAYLGQIKNKTPDDMSGSEQTEILSRYRDVQSV